MLNDVAAAFDRQDYRLAAQLLKDWLKQSPQDPWARLYWGRLHEVSGKLDSAEWVYRQLLRDTTNPKLMAQARQGMQRLEAIQQERRQQAIAAAMAAPDSSEPGFMVLEAVTGDDRTAAVQNFARVMRVDAYTARMLLPSRGWRLYRAGSTGELRVYGQELRNAGIPTFWASVPDIETIQVFQVNYFQSEFPNATVICHNDQGQVGELSFDWAEVSQRVEGMLPVFEQVLTIGYREQLERKEQTQDYARMCDLHLPSRRCILRLLDGDYEYGQGIELPDRRGTNALDHYTVRTNWNQLMDLLDQHLPSARVRSDFTPFAESAADFSVQLLRLNDHIKLFRSENSYWNPAFHLYSSLLFLQHQQQEAEPPAS